MIGAGPPPGEKGWAGPALPVMGSGKEGALETIDSFLASLLVYGDSFTELFPCLEPQGHPPVQGSPGAEAKLENCTI